MIVNIKKYAEMKTISNQDALQVWMQMVVLKNLLSKNCALIGGTALVIGHGNPRFSEDIDLTGIDDPMHLKSAVQKAVIELEGILGATAAATPPKPGRRTWRIQCRVNKTLHALLHIDSQAYPPLTHHPIVAEYPGIAPFVVSSVELDEIMADKIVALAFRKNISGRDIFDLWYHWLRSGKEIDAAIKDMVARKLQMRTLEKKDILIALNTRMSHGITRRVEEEWDRYLPSSLRDKALYNEMFATVQGKLSSITL